MLWYIQLDVFILLTESNVISPPTGWCFADRWSFSTKQLYYSLFSHRGQGALWRLTQRLASAIVVISRNLTARRTMEEEAHKLLEEGIRKKLISPGKGELPTFANGTKVKVYVRFCKIRISMKWAEKYGDACLEMLCVANSRLPELTHQAWSDICCVKRIQHVNVTAFTAK